MSNKQSAMMFNVRQHTVLLSAARAEDPFKIIVLVFIVKMTYENDSKQTLMTKQWATQITTAHSKHVSSFLSGEMWLMSVSRFQVCVGCWYFE